MTPLLDLTTHRFKASLNLVDTYGQCVDQIEALYMLCQHGRERARDNVSELTRCFAIRGSSASIAAICVSSKLFRFNLVIIWPIRLNVMKSNPFGSLPKGLNAVAITVGARISPSALFRSGFWNWRGT